MQKQLGTQYIIDFEGCDCPEMNDCDAVRKVFHEAAELAGCHIVNECFHEFNPFGVSGVTIISESHFAMHGWSEFNYAAVDLFYCGEVEIDKAIEHLKLFFKPTKSQVARIERGIS